MTMAEFTIALDNAWVVVVIVGGLILTPLLIANIRHEVKWRNRKR